MRVFEVIEEQHNVITGIKTHPGFLKGLKKKLEKGNSIKEKNYKRLFFFGPNFNSGYHSSYAFKVLFSTYLSNDLRERQFHFSGMSCFMYLFFFQIPLFQRGGSIIATKQRIRRCSALMHNDPYTLTLALNPKVRKHLFTMYLIRVTVALYH